MMPQLVFEALVYLHINKRFWSQNDVSLAMQLAKTEMAQQRVERDLQQLQLADDCDDE
jgi:hypothetical protein